MTLINLLASIALAFEMLTPRQVCKAFSRALGRPCRYVHDLKIAIRVPIPPGYKEQLDAIEILFGQMQAPFFPGFVGMTTRKQSDSSEFRAKRTSSSSKDGSPLDIRASAPKKIPPSPVMAATKVPSSPTVSASDDNRGSLTDEARMLWEGWRGMEEYAREVFPIEEENNGLDWMMSTSAPGF